MNVVELAFFDFGVLGVVTDDTFMNATAPVGESARVSFGNKDCKSAESTGGASPSRAKSGTSSSTGKMSSSSKSVGSAYAASTILAFDDNPSRTCLGIGDEGRSNASDLCDTGVRLFKACIGVGVRLPLLRTGVGVVAECFSLVDDLRVLIGGLGGEGVGSTDWATLFGDSMITKPASSSFAVIPGDSESSEHSESSKVSEPPAR